ncbi:hypothetical protein IWZ03DRAFT_357430 [Phyllosticta citriasiana]|uniref:Uncharacterized protein n=1 Tax=Phyllosticta citriasiana TaxID=595635 RepID=A0ABR1KUH6_9PEZI
MDMVETCEKLFSPATHARGSLLHQGKCPWRAKINGTERVDVAISADLVGGLAGSLRHVARPARRRRTILGMLLENVLIVRGTLGTSRLDGNDEDAWNRREQWVLGVEISSERAGLGAMQQQAHQRRWSTAREPVNHSISITLSKRCPSGGWDSPELCIETEFSSVAPSKATRYPRELYAGAAAKAKARSMEESMRTSDKCGSRLRANMMWVDVESQSSAHIVLHGSCKTPPHQPPLSELLLHETMVRD